MNAYTIVKIAEITMMAVIALPVLIGSAVAIAYAVKKQREENEKY